MSIKAFALEVIPQLNYVKDLKLNIWQTFIKESQVMFPASLKCLNLYGFTKDHIESFLPSLQFLNLSKLCFSDIKIATSNNIETFFNALAKVKVHTLIFNTYVFDMTPKGEPLATCTSFNYFMGYLE